MQYSIGRENDKLDKVPFSREFWHTELKMSIKRKKISQPSSMSLPHNKNSAENGELFPVVLAAE